MHSKARTDVRHAGSCPPRSGIRNNRWHRLPYNDPQQKWCGVNPKRGHQYWLLVEGKSGKNADMVIFTQQGSSDFRVLREVLFWMSATRMTSTGRQDGFYEVPLIYRTCYIPMWTITFLSVAICRCSHKKIPCQVPSASLPFIIGMERLVAVSADLIWAGISSSPSRVWV